MKQKYLISLIVWLGVSMASAQSVQYSAELGGGASSGRQNPFWLRTNQYATVPLRGSFGTFRLGLVRDYRPRPDTAAKRKNRLDWGLGLYAVGNAGPRLVPTNPTVLLPDAYAKVRFGQFELFAGNRREVYGLGDTLLTSGFMAWSGNALPFPKVQLHTPDFVPLGFTRKAIWLRAGYAHGWLIDSYIRGSYLHQKYLYARLGKPHWRMRLYGGLNHSVQWGGRADYLIGTDLSVDGSLPTSFQDYVSLVLGRYPEDVRNNRYTEFDGTNRIGNHVGTYDLALEWNGLRSNYLLYHQHYYEDASGLALRNGADGLTGLRFQNRKAAATRFRIERVVLEWLSTTNQSGPTFNFFDRFQGADNYFNNSQYVEGWSYRGHTLGTPFIAPRASFSDRANAQSGPGYFSNNRVVMWYGGLSGGFRRGPTLTARASYSRNFGSFRQSLPTVLRQFSGLLSAQWPLGIKSGTVLTTSLAVDRGGLFPVATGGYVSLKKDW